MRPGRYLDGRPEERHFRLALVRPQLVDKRVDLRHTQARSHGFHSTDERPSHRQGVAGSEVVRLKIGHRIEGKPCREERVDEGGQLVRVAGGESYALIHAFGRHPLTVVESRPGVRARDKECGGHVSAPRSHDESSVGLQESGEVTKGGQLIERRPVTHRLSTSKGDHYAITQTGSERVAPSGVLSGRDLGAQRGHRGQQNNNRQNTV